MPSLPWLASSLPPPPPANFPLPPSYPHRHPEAGSKHCPACAPPMKITHGGSPARTGVSLLAPTCQRGPLQSRSSRSSPTGRPAAAPPTCPPAPAAAPCIRRMRSPSGNGIARVGRNSRHSWRSPDLNKAVVWGPMPVATQTHPFFPWSASCQSLCMCRRNVHCRPAPPQSTPLQHKVPSATVLLAKWPARAPNPSKPATTAAPVPPGAQDVFQASPPHKTCMAA